MVLYHYPKDSGSRSVYMNVINPTEAIMNEVSKRPTSPRVGASRAKKEKIVAKLADKVNRAKGLVFTNYQGLTHKQLEALKKTIKSLNAELVVTKNTLLKLSLDKSTTGLTGTTRRISPRDTRATLTPRDTPELEGPTATLFLYADPIEPLKQLAKTIKELNLPIIKFGIIDGQNLTSEKIMKLASLPSHDVLITQLLFQMKAPLYRLHHALNWNLQKLVLILKAVETKKQN